MSTSSTWSAARTTASGTRSRCGTPVIFSTTSLSDSRCWMLTVEMTSMPAASSSSMSCQRFSFRDPGTLVCASSSTRATCGRRARTASTSISVKDGTAVGELAPRRHLQAGRAGRPCAGVHVSRRSRRRRRCRARHDGDPRRASRRSCRPRVRPRGRPVASRGRPHRQRPAAASSARLSSSTLTRGSPRKPEDPALGVLGHQGSDLGHVEAALPGHPGDLLLGVRRADVRVEPRAAGQQRVRGNPGRRDAVERGGRGPALPDQR